MKGIIISGGKGTRLKPMSEVSQKQLLPIYDKPMIYYALSLLMLLEIKDIAIVTTSQAFNILVKLLHNGEKLGISIHYIIEEAEECDGIAHAMLRCEDFIQGDNFAMILGDTLLHGAELTSYLTEAKMKLAETNQAVVFETFVSNPSDFGTIIYDDDLPLEVVEKSRFNQNCRAIPGIYFLTGIAMEYAKVITPSARNEYEITSIINEYVKRRKLNIKKCGRGIIWIDTGTPKAILDASTYVSLIQNSLGIVLACLEEIAYNNKWITKCQLEEISIEYNNTEYGEYLKKLCC